MAGIVLAGPKRALLAPLAQHQLRGAARLRASAGGTSRCALLVLLAPAAAWHSPCSAMRRRAFTSSAARMMPEGPEVMYLARSIDALVGGGRFMLTDVQLRSGRYVDGADPTGWDELRAQLPLEIERCSCRGKFLFFSLGKREHPARFSLWSTLGLTGWWTTDSARAHTRVVLVAARVDPAAADAADEPREVRLAYVDARNFGTLRFSAEPSELDAKIASLGLAWLDGECGWEPFHALARRSATRSPRRPLAVFLMDQSKTAGVGNYILSEALYRARIDPFASCGALRDEDWRALHSAISAVMVESLATQGNSWRERFEMRVYARAVDPEGRAVRRAVGPHKRTVHFVPEVQHIGRAPAFDSATPAAAGPVGAATGSEAE
ncbi:hypothetical protein KFE25_001732 [Diacronema lutheri]|uniref:Formamidopyrimidine-DNA glycosylase catalytic domain-containing protein n=2 Tax=Diacronema lutheri TaxID=2081491 RepID=A0A8J5XEC0_DIALT|nr:hypothetical protein KFE25_001732 [Diacronema lutheri]